MKRLKVEAGAYAGVFQLMQSNTRLDGSNAVCGTVISGHNRSSYDHRVQEKECMLERSVLGLKRKDYRSVEDRETEGRNMLQIKVKSILFVG